METASGRHSLSLGHYGILLTEGHDVMEEQHGTVQDQTNATGPKRGIWMFKDHVASMRSGSRLLGGERENAGKDTGHSQESE